MLMQEARWFGAPIAEMDEERIFPMLDVGSHTAEFRTKHQPWIDRYIFAPARRRRRAVIHLDIRAGAGVDIVGDLTDPSFLRELMSMKFRSVFTSNLLEHVPNRDEVARAMTRVVPVGGYVFVSCPFTFPYHADPIDTMFRPGIAELAALFPGTVIHRAEIVDGGSLAGYVLARACRHPGAFLKTLVRRGRRASGADRLASARHLIPWMFRRFRETCLVLLKQTERR